MADPISIAGVVFATVRALSDLLDLFSPIAIRNAELSSALASLEICFEKVEVFAFTWGYSNSKQDEVSPAHILWDETLSLGVQRVLNETLDAIRKIKDELYNTKHPEPRSFLRRCFSWIHKSSHTYDVETINRLVSTLSDFVEEGWAYYHAASEAQDLISSQLAGSIAKLPDDKSAQEAKEVGLALFDICCTTDEPCSIDLNLLPSAFNDSKKTATESLPQLSYRLFIQSRRSPEKLRQISITGTTSSQASNVTKLYQESKTDDVAAQLGFVHIKPQEEMLSAENGSKPNVNYLRRFVDSELGKTFEILQTGLNEPVYLKVTQPSFILIPTPRFSPLVELFSGRRNSSSLDPGNVLSFLQKIELAHTVVQYGFYTLGTPWASLLKLRNIQKMTHGDGEAQYVLSLSDTVCRSSTLDNPDALAEASHLLQIGMLLIEIGLQKSISTADPETIRSWSDRVKTLAQVERAMGTEYCKATAFCLQPRHAQVQSQKREKFDYSINKTWRNYSSEILGEYRECVLKRIHALRKIVMT